MPTDAGGCLKMNKIMRMNARGSFMRKIAMTVLAGLMAGALSGGVAMAAAPDGKTVPMKPVVKNSPLDEIFSGYYITTKETRAMQDDDFDNPGMMLLEQAESEWSKVEGQAGKSCKSCHNDYKKSMKGVFARYPVYYDPWKKPINMEQRINECRKKYMKAKPYKYESSKMQGMTVLIGVQSRGMPMSVRIDDKLKPFFEKGKAFYYKRRGQLDMACAHCHENYYGGKIRSNLLSQGQINGFPAYRLKWQKVGSLHRRFAGCNKNIRAKPYPRGADEYVNLELYLRWRGKGLKIETPAVRM
jgi:sulfur-oxidizing protein SoxA